MRFPRALFLSVFIGSGFAVLSGCETVGRLARTVGAENSPTSEQIVAGLKAALLQGTSHAVAELSKPGGFLSDSFVRIPFPEEASYVVSALRTIGLGSLVSEFETRLNRGAEAGASDAASIFKAALADMTFADATAVLLGEQHAATDYFKAKTYDALAARFAPEIEQALGQVGATTAWTEIATAYNAIPLLSKKLETDIVQYATTRALDGLFLKVAGEEERIRAEPIARSTELLKEVFSWAAARR